MMRRLICLLMMTASVCACEKVGAGYGTPATSTSPGLSAGATPSPAASGVASSSQCNTTQSATVFVGMSSAFAETTIATFGEIAGYADITDTTPAQAGTIQATTTDTIQFANLDTETMHSAVGFPQSAESVGFPAEPYAFPTAEASPQGSVIGTAAWSTGPVPGSSTVTCLSQPFTVPVAGTYYFGDLTFYNTITSYRDVIIVSSPASTAKRRR